MAPSFVRVGDRSARLDPGHVGRMYVADVGHAPWVNPPLVRSEFAAEGASECVSGCWHGPRGCLRAA